MTIEKIKKDINNNVGNKVRVIHNEGRNKIYECNGKITEVYNNIFIVMSDDAVKKSFSYRDILTNSIKITFKM